ncbi:UbiD family decarboxylase [Mesorhizobium sp. M8A.F.Ca.ET.165.01.1.1]|nr:UbiD family decarboxylase [Mesorhizobium sp. M8A.F.Ca.ET.182.01.1.1]TGS77323.1 UbiD family decarboxylase [Mesorhizobium sp. M8A.F.Ca.ET.181.01.1.1]TGT36295.1 UbiD family decarboxylase [Mesorhizobium sp. M8A.F.Ca.ET.165.01.1.1]
MIAPGRSASMSASRGELRTEETFLVSYADLRGFIEALDNQGMLRRVPGADPHLEVGAVTEVAANLPECPALLFDKFDGYPAGFRVFTNATNSSVKAAIALGLDPSLAPLEALKRWKEKRSAFQRSGPLPQRLTEPLFLENTMAGHEVDLACFPVPQWHADDGGRYIGSGSLVVMGDPDSDWVNASIYRVQVQTANTVTIQFDHLGRHGAILAKKFWDQGKSCPVAIVNGQDPSLFLAGFEALPAGYSEYDFAGAVKGEAIPLARAPLTQLLVPALAESILEGYLLDPKTVMAEEGPFGEFTGYYAADRRPQPVMQVDAVHFRHNPILFASPPLKPPLHHFGLPLKAATLWTLFENAGVTDVTGVWQHVSSLVTVVAVKQRYDGHAKRAGLIAAANSYMGRLIILVDDDIDPSNMDDVLWAVATRCEPSDSIDIIRNGWSSALDPRIPPEAKELGVTAHSKAIIDACRPYAWSSRFPPSTALHPAEAKAVSDKWATVLRAQTTRTEEEGPAINRAGTTSTAGRAPKNGL